MPRKRYKPGVYETLLTEVVAGLEAGGKKAEAAVYDLFEWGPLVSSRLPGQSFLVERAAAPEFQDLADLLLKFLRDLVRRREADTIPGELQTRRTLIFNASLDDGRVVVGVKGADVRDVIVLQFIVLLEQVGLHNVRACDAPDCERIYVKTNRRLFCSPQCQKRIYARAMRGRQRELQERRARARRRRARGE